MKLPTEFDQLLVEIRQGISTYQQTTNLVVNTSISYIFKAVNWFCKHNQILQKAQKKKKKSRSQRDRILQQWKCLQKFILQFRPATANSENQYWPNLIFSKYLMKSFERNV